MKNLYCESSSIYYAELKGEPPLASKSFLKAASKAVTLFISNILGVENVADYLCIRFEKFHTVRYVDCKGQMSVDIEHKTQPYKLCTFFIKWIGADDSMIKTTDEVRSSDINFEIQMDQYEEAKLKYCFFNDIYFSVVKKENSGLHFDYEVKCGSENVIFRIRFSEDVTNVSEISHKVKQFFTKPDEYGHIIEPGWFVARKTSPKAVKIEVDLGSIDCSETIIEDFMKYLDDNFNNIKKVVAE